MRMMFALPALAYGLTACQPVVPPPLQPAPVADYRAIGTEPFWDLTIGHDLTFTDRGTGVSVVEQAPPPIATSGGLRYRGGQIEVTIVHRQCSDGMSERVYPDRVSVTVEGRPFEGCGAESAFYARVGEDGRPR